MLFSTSVLMIGRYCGLWSNRVVLKIKSIFSFLSGQAIALPLLVDNRPVQNLRAFVFH